MGGLRTMPRFDLDTTFLEIYTQEEKKQIGRLLKILGDFMLLETSMIYKVYEKRHGEKIQLKMIKKAARDLLITEFKYNLGFDDEKPLFFYCLKKNGGDHILQSGEYEFQMLPYFWTSEQYTKLLTFNRYIIDNKPYEKIKYDYIELVDKGIFITKSINAYFLTKIISEEETKNELSEIYVSNNERIEVPLSGEINEYIPINLDLIDFGRLTSGVPPKQIS